MPRILIIGVGAFTHGLAQRLSETGNEVIIWLNRDYGHFGAQLCAQQFPHNLAFTTNDYATPLALLDDYPCQYMVPMSIDWAEQPWADAVNERCTVFCPLGESLLLERDRAYAAALCAGADIPVPRSFVADNRIKALAYVEENPAPYVLKNTLCSPTSPIHTIVCETIEDTVSWLERVDYAEGVYLQEYLGTREAGHIAMVNGDSMTSLVSNQEYKRAFHGNQGKIAGAPLGGIVEYDPEDKYGIAKQCIEPLLPWFAAVNYKGPVQVTVMQKDEQWHVIEYNCRLGVMCGSIIMQMLNNPIALLEKCRDPNTVLSFDLNKKIGVSVTLAGHGYPYLEVTGPAFPLFFDKQPDADIWFNEVAFNDVSQQILADGHRLLDVNAYGNSVDEALSKAYRQMDNIRCSSSYYRSDIGLTMWPPGSD